MEDNAIATKAAITAFFASISIVLGWFGWLIVALIGAMSVDYFTGWASARNKGSWKSSIAKRGLTKKVGILCIVAVAGCVDLVLGQSFANAGIQLPFAYTVLICPIVALWYLFAELGSIIENAVCLGAPCPEFLAKTIKILKSTIEKAGDKIIPDK